jgi:hypothetical protein
VEAQRPGVIVEEVKLYPVKARVEESTTHPTADQPLGREEPALVYTLSL